MGCIYQNTYFYLTTTHEQLFVRLPISRNFISCILIIWHKVVLWSTADYRPTTRQLVVLGRFHTLKNYVFLCWGFPFVTKSRGGEKANASKLLHDLNRTKTKVYFEEYGLDVGYCRAVRCEDLESRLVHTSICFLAYCSKHAFFHATAKVQADQKMWTSWMSDAKAKVYAYP